MLELTLEYDYLTVDTDAWLDDRSTVNEERTAQLRAFLEEREEQYATDEGVTAWLETFGEVSGIYGEDGPVTFHGCNVDNLLDRDISFIFAHAGEDETFIIVNGYGWTYAGSDYVEVRDFNGYDDSEAFEYARGWLAHEDHAADEKCGTEWILDEPNRMWRNGGMGDNPRLDECIVKGEDEDETPRIVCPDCGGTLTAYVG